MPIWFDVLLCLLFTAGAVYMFRSSRGKPLTRKVIGTAFILLAVLTAMYLLAVAVLIGGVD
jgi:hypothetical protein